MRKGRIYDIDMDFVKKEIINYMNKTGHTQERIKSDTSKYKDPFGVIDSRIISDLINKKRKSVTHQTLISLAKLLNIDVDSLISKNIDEINLSNINEKYNEFIENINKINSKNIEVGETADGTYMVQVALDFFVRMKSFYENNYIKIGNNKIDESLKFIQNLIDNGKLNEHTNPDRYNNIKSLFYSVIEVINDIFLTSIRKNTEDN